MIFAWGERKRKERVRYCHLREDTKRVCARVKKEEDAQERKINLSFLIIEGKTIPWCGRKFIPY